ncbi:MAG: DUF4906 domain-containing protein [Bacteroidales bacterium]|nr:DUF4906 domain-containing protein [Bacteroidales bacterium]
MRNIELMLSVLLCTACVGAFQYSDEMEVNEDVELSFDVIVAGLGNTKSMIEASDVISDINIFAYSGGQLADYLYSEQLSSLSLSLVKGEKYNLYAVANVGRVAPSGDEISFRESYTYAVSAVSDMSARLPFSWARSGWVADGGDSKLQLELVRMVSRIWLSVDLSALAGLEVTGARLCQTPNVMRPFAAGGSKAEKIAEVGAGDAASEKDISLLNSGGSICFYTLENCQGMLLPDNSDPWEKIPHRISEVSALCSYLELDCTFADQSQYGGNVTYRLYLGEDNTSDFNVRRNSELYVAMTVTEEGLGKLSWKITADVEWAGDYADYEFAPAGYIHQFGVLTLHDVSSGSPATVTLGGTRVEVTGVAQQSARIYRCEDSDGNIAAVMTILPDCPHKVFIYGALPGVRTLRIDKGVKSAVIDFAVKNVRLAVCSGYSGSGNIVVNESGTEDELDVFLTDAQTGDVLPLSDFFYPEDYAEWMGEHVDHPVRDFSISMESRSGNGDGISYGCSLAGCGLDDDEEYLCSYRFYGLDSCGEDVYTQYVDVVEENSFWNVQGTGFSLDVQAAFPGQRHLGEFVNMQLAPGDSRNSMTEIGFGSQAPAKASAWELRRTTGLDHAALKPDEHIWNRGVELSDKMLEYNYVYGKSSLALSCFYPQPDYDGAADFFPCGSIIAKGSVTNKHSGRIIEGYYSFDLVLYLTVGVQIDVETDGMSSTLGYSFVPFTEYSTHAYSDFWSDSPFPSISVVSKVINNLSDRYSKVHVPESYETNSIFMPMTDSFNDSSLDSSWNSLINYLYPYRYNIFRFDFCNSQADMSFDSLDLTREGSAAYQGCEYLEYGHCGYYKIERQYDVANLPEDSRLENHLVEAAYGSFENF